MTAAGKKWKGRSMYQVRHALEESSQRTREAAARLDAAQHDLDAARS